MHVIWKSCGQCQLWWQGRMRAKERERERIHQPTHSTKPNEWLPIAWCVFFFFFFFSCITVSSRESNSGCGCVCSLLGLYFLSLFVCVKEEPSIIKNRKEDYRPTTKLFLARYFVLVVQVHYWTEMNWTSLNSKTLLWELRSLGSFLVW